MNSIFSTGASALQAYGVKIQSNANNIANANTDGFKKTRTLLSSQEPVGVQATTQQTTSAGPIVPEELPSSAGYVESSNVDLAEELVDMKISSTLYSANLKSLKTADAMAASLLDIKS